MITSGTISNSALKLNEIEEVCRKFNLVIVMEKNQQFRFIEDCDNKIDTSFLKRLQEKKSQSPN